MSYSPISAAFEGFRLIVRRPVSFLAWSAVAATTLLAVAEMSFISQGAASPGGRNPAAGLLGPLLTLASLVIGYSVVACAAYRAVLRPDQRRIGSIRLGGAELRVMGITVLVVVFTGIVLSVLSVGLSIVGAVLGGWARWLPGLIVVLGMAVMGVRLSLIGPVALLGRGDSVAASWELSGQRFWSLLGMWAIVTAVSVLVGFLISLLFSALTIDIHVAPGWQTPVAAHLSPAGLVAIGVVALVVTIQTVLWTAPAAAAYAGLTRRDETPIEVFD